MLAGGRNQTAARRWSGVRCETASIRWWVRQLLMRGPPHV